VHAVAGTRDEFFVVGSNGTILRNTDGRWDLEDSRCINTLQAVAVSESGVYATGSGGAILKRT
jgi:hypothetical protein